jgi:MarR family transcriptional regulator, lower aerobic nicotinate degradation pathway regulator
VARSVRQFVAAQAEPLGLSIQQFWAIVAVAENACASQVELAARLHVDEATACRVVRALGEANLLAATRDPHDRRRVRLSLAPAGEVLARRLVPVARQVRGVIDSALTSEERAAMRASFDKVLARLGALLEALPAVPTAPPPAGRAPSPRPSRSPSAPGRRPSRSPASLRGRP